MSDGNTLTGPPPEPPVAEGVSPHIANPELQSLSLSGAGLDRWLRILGERGIVQGAVSEFPRAERAILEPQDIRSLAVVPIYVSDGWWGFMGFDDCVEPRTWTESEPAVLRAAADPFGGAGCSMK